MEIAGKPRDGPVFAKRQSSHMQIIRNFPLSHITVSYILNCHCWAPGGRGCLVQKTYCHCRSGTTKATAYRTMSIHCQWHLEFYTWTHWLTLECQDDGCTGWTAEEIAAASWIHLYHVSVTYSAENWEYDNRRSSTEPIRIPCGWSQSAR